MPLSSTKRALIAVAAMICVAGAGAGVYLYRSQRPLPGLSAGPAPDIMTELPADAPVIAYIDVAALRKLQYSRLGAALGLTTSVPQSDREYTEFVRETGFDYARDLDRAAIAFWPAGLASTGNALGEDRILAIADGRFDERKIEAYALRSGKTVNHGTHSVYQVPGNPPVSFQFLSPTRIVLGGGKDADNLVAATNSPARDPAMQARIGRVAGAPIFAVARTDNLPSSFYANFKNLPQLERLARSVRGLTLAGQPDGDRLKLALDAECDSMKDALEIATLLDGFRMVGSLALSDPKTRRRMTKEQAEFLDALINQVKVTHQDHWVRLNLDITPEMLGAVSGIPSTPRPHIPAQLPR